jgi:hypothetical protein
MTTSTWVASGSSIDGNLDAEATITISANNLAIDLSNLEGNPKDPGQEISGIQINFVSAVSGPTNPPTQTGSLIDIGQNGTVTPQPGSPTHWQDSESGDTFTLTTIGNGTPIDMIIGPPDGSGVYSNANGGLTSGNFDPFIQNTGTFDIPF